MRDSRLCVGVVICAAMLFSFSVSSSVCAQERISLTAKLTESTDEIAAVIVSFEIEEGWHAYAETEIGQVLEVELELPDDVVPAGRWQKPEAVPYDDGAMIYEGEGSFSRKLSIPASDAVRQVVVTVAYQVCNKRGCMAPDEAQFELSIPATVPSPTAPEKASYHFDNAHFSTPVLLIADGELLNTSAGQNYVSPAMYDVDRDGDLELITGGVGGRIRVYENENNDQGGTPVWTDVGFLRTTSGEKVMAKNW